MKREIPLRYYPLSVTAILLAGAAACVGLQAREPEHWLALPLIAQGVGAGYTFQEYRALRKIARETGREL